MDQLKITIRRSKLQKRFIEAFKKQVVREFKQGLLNKDQLQFKYGLGGTIATLYFPFTIAILLLWYNFFILFFLYDRNVYPYLYSYNAGVDRFFCRL